MFDQSISPVCWPNSLTYLIIRKWKQFNVLLVWQEILQKQWLALFSLHYCVIFESSCPSQTHFTNSFSIFNISNQLFIYIFYSGLFAYHICYLLFPPLFLLPMELLGSLIIKILKEVWLTPVTKVPKIMVSNWMKTRVPPLVCLRLWVSISMLSGQTKKARKYWWIQKVELLPSSSASIAADLECQK